MTLCIHAGSLQHVPQLVAVSQGTLHNQIDVSTYKVIGVAVVRTEHHHVWTLVDKRTQQLIVLGSTTLADDDIHASPDTCTTLVQRRAFMVGGDASGSIAVALLTFHSRGMTIHRLVIAQGCLYLRHHVLVTT